MEDILKLRDVVAHVPLFWIVFSEFANATSMTDSRWILAGACIGV